MSDQKDIAPNASVPFLLFKQRQYVPLTAT